MIPTLLAAVYLAAIILTVDHLYRFANKIYQRLTGAPAIYPETRTGYLLGLIPPVSGLAIAGIFWWLVPGFSLSGRMLGETPFQSIAAGASLGLACCILTIGACWLGRLLHAERPPRNQMKTRTRAFTLVSVDLLIAATFEEVIFRGHLLYLLQDSMGTLAAIFLSSLIFGLLHVWKRADAPLLWGVNTTLFGILATLLALGTGSLVAPIALHFVWNLVETPILGLPANGSPYENGLLKCELEGPPAITGGAWSLDAGLVSTGALVAGVLAVAVFI